MDRVVNVRAHIVLFAGRFQFASVACYIERVPDPPRIRGDTRRCDIEARQGHGLSDIVQQTGPVARFNIDYRMIPGGVIVKLHAGPYGYSGLEQGEDAPPRLLDIGFDILAVDKHRLKDPLEPGDLGLG